VLEVGCGKGWLTRALAEAGHDAMGIDPEAPDEDLFRRTTLEDFTDARPNDVVAAVLSLHHISDVPAALEKINTLLAPGGRFVVVEFAWENLDDATLGWCLARLPSDPQGEEGWLRRRCADWRERLQRGESVGAEDHVREWARGEQLHPATEILSSLRGMFRQSLLQWTPYLYPELEVTVSEEQAAIDRGEIRPTGFRFVGTRSELQRVGGTHG
jgi:SAM-dependent methyltransferase